MIEQILIDDLTEIKLREPYREMALAHVVGDKVEAAAARRALGKKEGIGRRVQVLHQFAGRPDGLRRGRDTARRRPMSDKLDWDIAIVGYDLTQQARYLDAIINARQSGGPEPVMDSGRRQTYFVQFIDDNDGRRSFYEALLKIKWLPSTIRRAVMRELGQSLQKHKRSIEDARTVTLEFLVKQCKAQMRANGERPQGGIHEAAVAQVATSQGMSPEALKQRITRRKKRPSK